MKIEGWKERHRDWAWYRFLESQNPPQGLASSNKATPPSPSPESHQVWTKHSNIGGGQHSHSNHPSWKECERKAGKDWIETNVFWTWPNHCTGRGVAAMDACTWASRHIVQHGGGTHEPSSLPQEPLTAGGRRGRVCFVLFVCLFVCFLRVWSLVGCLLG